MIFSGTEKEHFEQVDQVLTLVCEAGVKFKLKKCFFFHERVEYLGHVITPGSLSVANNSKATCAVREASFPESVIQLRRFLSACNVYRYFVKDYSKIATPLSDMLRKDASNNWHNPRRISGAPSKSTRRASHHLLSWRYPRPTGRL